ARSRPPVLLEAETWGDALVRRNAPGDLDRSLRIYREAPLRTQDAMLPSAHFRRALARYRAGDLDGAPDDLDLAVRVDPSDAMSRSLHADILVRKGFVWSALHHFAQASGLARSDADPYEMRGFRFAVENDLRSARNDLEVAVDVRPQDVE